jgi:hypothetical protein
MFANRPRADRGAGQLRRFVGQLQRRTATIAQIASIMPKGPGALERAVQRAQRTRGSERRMNQCLRFSSA